MPAAPVSAGWQLADYMTTQEYSPGPFPFAPIPFRALAKALGAAYSAGNRFNQRLSCERSKGGL